MADLEGKIKIWSRTAADFASDNPVLERGQFAYEYDAKKLKCGDGATAYNALAYIGATGGGGQVDSITGTANRITVDLTDPTNPVLNISGAYDTAITNAIAAAVSGKEDTSNKQTDLTPSATKYPTVNAVIAGLSAKKSYAQIIHSGGQNPTTLADNTYYYFGILGVAPSSSGVNTATYIREQGCIATGTIKTCILSIRSSNGNVASNENNTLSLRNTTQNTLDTISSTITYGSAAGTGVYLKTFVITGLNIAVTVGDELQSVIGNANFATNPATVYWNATYIVELP